MHSDDVGVLVADPDEGVLVTLLPGMEDKRYCSKDEKDLKAEAERWLEEFAASLGAIFPEPAADVRTDQTLIEALGVGEDDTARIQRELREDFGRIEAAERAARTDRPETAATAPREEERWPPT